MNNLNDKTTSCFDNMTQEKRINYCYFKSAFLKFATNKQNRVLIIKKLKTF